MHNAIAAADSTESFRSCDIGDPVEATESPLVVLIVALQARDR
jgi:hypothetical protein